MQATRADVPGMDPRQVEKRVGDAFDGIVLDSLRPLAWSLAAIYALITPSYQFLAPVEALRVLVPMGIFGIVAYGGFLLGTQGRMPAARHANGWLSAFAAIPIVTTTVFLLLTREPVGAAWLALIQIGLGLFVLASTVYVILSMSVVAAAILSFAFLPLGTEWVFFVVYFATAMILSAPVHVLRSSSYRRTEILRMQEEAARSRLQHVAEDHRESEERYRILSNASFQGILMHHEGRILEANDAVLRLVGTDRRRLRGANILDFVPEASHAEVRQRLAQDVEGRFPLTIQRADGTLVPVEIDSRLVPYRGTRARVVTLRDLSERQRTEEAQRLADERERQIERLEELDRLRTQFLNNSAHELATPLTPIQIQFAILDRRGMQNLDEAQRRALQLIRRNFERLARLVRALLDAAQIQRGVLGLDRRVFPVHEMLRDLEATFATTARDRGIEFAVMTDVAITVHADRVRIGQVLENLLENAFKFTPRYGRVSLEASLEDGAARLRVADTGIGLTPEQRERLFRPFAQPYDDTHAVPTGAGLGLFVARGIVEAHGSRLEVDSPGHGHGATFAFRLPLAERAA